MHLMAYCTPSNPIQSLLGDGCLVSAYARGYLSTFSCSYLGHTSHPVPVTPRVPDSHDNQLWNGIRDRHRMRGDLLRCVLCKHRKDKLITHFPLGCYTILFALSTYLIFHVPRRGTSFNKPILIISGLLYLSCSTHFVLQFSLTFIEIFVCSNPY
jgi:hypothetical protein